MKNKILFIFISVFVLMIGANKVGATVIYQDENYTIDEEFIYNDLVTNYSDDFDFTSYNQAICDLTCSSGDSRCVSCIFITSDDILNSTYGSYSSFLRRHTFNYNDDVTEYYYIYYYNGSAKGVSDLTTRVNSVFSLTNNAFTSFELPSSNNPSLANYNNENINTLNFIQYFSPEPEEPEPVEPIEEEYTIENKIYLPIELEENMCPYILDKDTIRVYDEEPTENSTITYTDYFINSHYISKSGSETFENDVLMCLDKSKFTTAFYYRFDFDEIMIIFISMLMIVYVIFGKIIHSFFIGFRR